MAGPPYGAGAGVGGHRGGRVGQLVGAGGGPVADAPQVAEQPRACRARSRTVVRSPIVSLHGHLDHGPAVPLDEVEHLDVEGEAIDPPEREHRLGHVGAERLQPALRVVRVAEQHRHGQQVHRPAAEVAERAGPVDARRVRVAPVPDGDVPPVLDPGEHQEELVGRVGEVGVGERDRAPAGGGHPGADGGALAAVLREHHHLVGARRRARRRRCRRWSRRRPPPPRGRRRRPTVGERAADGRDRGADPIGLVEGGDDDAWPARRPGAAGRGTRSWRRWRTDCSSTAR